jgi:type III pantothenate kinase
MNFAIDIGNTFIKIGLFEEKTLVHSYHHLKEEDLEELIVQHNPTYVIISSVRGNVDRIQSIFKSASKVVVLNESAKVPFKNLYKTPQTLGMDRVAAAAGSMDVFPESDRLIIDAGTCITYDFMDQHNQYFGGAISPGIDMRFKALNTFTGKLPLISRMDPFPKIGSNTEESIQSGVMNGVLAETEGIINQYKEKFPGLKVILCGGDAGFFESKIKETIFVVADLVLVGLNTILLHNVSED